MNFLKKVWRDPVISKILANIIWTGLVALAWGVSANARIGIRQVQKVVVDFFTTPIEFWKYFLVILFVMLALYIFQRR